MTPLMRLQDTLAKHMGISVLQKQAAKDFDVVVVPCLYPEFHEARHDFEYFGASLEQQEIVEQFFIAAIWEMEMPSTHGAFRPMVMDSVSQIIQQIKKMPTPLCSRYEFISVDVTTSFALRITLLANMALNGKSSIASDALTETASAVVAQAKHWQGIKHTLTPEFYLGEARQNMVEHLDHLSDNRRPELKLVRTNLRPLAQANPLFCCLNNIHIRMFTAIHSVSIIDQSFVVQLLGHLWNMLKEEGYLGNNWEDLDFLVNALGGQFIYQGERPNMRAGREALVHRIWYFMGLKKKDVVKLRSHLSHRGPKPSFYQKVHFISRFIASDMPVFWILNCREGWHVRGYDIGAVDSALVANAVVVPPILAQKPTDVIFNTKNIKNRPELFKLFDKAPMFAATTLLSLLKKGLTKDFAMLDFDYLAFQKQSLQLVDKLVQVSDDFDSTIFDIYEARTTTDQLKFVAWHLLLPDEEELHANAAQVFKEWLDENDSVGIQGIPRKSEGTSFPLPLKPQLVRVVRDIVARRGLMDDVFIPEQEWGLGVTSKGSIESAVRTAWATHKKGKKA